MTSEQILNSLSYLIFSAATPDERVLWPRCGRCQALIPLGRLLPLGRHSAEECEACERLRREAEKQEGGKA